LSHLTGRKGDVEKCPEVEILSARGDSEGAAEIAEKIRQHAQTCPICSDLRERLKQFDEEDVAGRDARSAVAEGHADEEGSAAEERLDVWFKEFLAARRRK
jgi:hypothetical protein